VTTLAGNPASIGSNDGVRAAAQFNTPAGITTDGTNLYIADTDNNIIRKLVLATGAVTTLAGSAPTAGAVNGTGASALFNSPEDITTDGTNLYVADTYNYAIRKVVIATGAVTTLAGDVAKSGSTDGVGASALFNSPEGISTDGTNLYVADTMSDTVRVVVIATGSVSTLTGTPTVVGATDGSNSTALFNQPEGITTDGTSLYVADTTNNTVRKIQ
jgi:sugar lactone lactonase YvrE